MATSPAPVLTITGTARNVQLFERVENTETGESRQAARVQVLTDFGGFVEVYVNADNLDVLPASVEGDPFEPFPVAWDVEVSAWNRVAWGQENVPPSERRRYATLSLRFRQVTGARAARTLVSVSA
jgi:hypothetical protein